MIECPMLFQSLLKRKLIQSRGKYFKKTKILILTHHSINQCSEVSEQ